MELVQNLKVISTQPVNAAEERINGLRIEWLPSVPLVKKHKVPSICGYGILYSEELEQVLHSFPTHDLTSDLNQKWQAQARALATDPNCRLYWLETSEPEFVEIESQTQSVSYG